MTQYEVVNENGENFGGPHESWEQAEADRDVCEELYDGHFYIEEVEPNDSSTVGDKGDL